MLGNHLEDCKIAVKAKPKTLDVGSVFLSTAPRQVELDSARGRFAIRLPAPRIKLREISKDEKQCSDCGEVRGKQMFSPHKQGRDGLHPQCKPCRNKYARFRYYLQKQAA